MPTKDTCCSIAPYFTVPSENLTAFKAICQEMVTKTSEEPRCLYYGFTFHEDQAHCREGYVDADALSMHVQNVDSLLGELVRAGELVRIEIHGPEDELAKLRGPLAHLKPQFFVLEHGFRR